MGRALLGEFRVCWENRAGESQESGWVGQQGAQPRHKEEVGGSSYGLEVAWKPLFPELSGEAGRPNSRSPLFASPEPGHLRNGDIRQSGV